MRSGPTKVTNTFPGPAVALVNTIRELSPNAEAAIVPKSCGPVGVGNVNGAVKLPFASELIEADPIGCMTGMLLSTNARPNDSTKTGRCGPVVPDAVRVVSLPETATVG